MQRCEGLYRLLNLNGGRSEPLTTKDTLWLCSGQAEAHEGRGCRVCKLLLGFSFVYLGALSVVNALSRVTAKMLHLDIDGSP